MFTFKGTSVSSFKTLGAVMAQLKDRAEGEELLAACEGEFGKADAKIVLGYLIGYFVGESRDRVLRNLPRGIEHPVWGTQLPSDPLGDEAVSVAITMAKLWANAQADVEPFNPIAFKKQETKAKDDRAEMVREEAEWNF